MRASTKVSLTALITLALATPALAQDTRRPTGSGSSTGGSATSRGGGSSSGGSSAGSSSSSGGSVGSSSGSSSTGRTAVSRPSREPQSSARRPSSGTAQGGGPVIPAYSRPRGSNAVRGTVAERGDNPLPNRDIFYGYPSYGYYGYNNGFYGSRSFYGYPVYTGFGYFYYDPYWGFYDPFYSRGYYAYGPYGTRYKDKDDRDYNIGSLRLKIEPAHAEVYVDGLYRGIVDDFDGLLQRLKLEAGAHRLEVRAGGLQTLVFDVLVTPGETTTYRGNLKR